MYPRRRRTHVIVIAQMYTRLRRTYVAFHIHFHVYFGHNAKGLDWIPTVAVLHHAVVGLSSVLFLKFYKFYVVVTPLHVHVVRSINCC